MELRRGTGGLVDMEGWINPFILNHQRRLDSQLLLLITSSVIPHHLFTLTPSHIPSLAA